MKLYSYYRSSAAYRVRIALNLKGIDYDLLPVHLVRDGGEHKQADYLSKNPQGLVPLLELDHDGEPHYISQSMAMLEYLDEVYPDPSLLPTAPLAKAHVRSLAQTIASDIHPLNNLRVLKYLATELDISDEQKTAWYQHWVKLGFDALEATLSKQTKPGKFCYGDTPTIADCCLVPQVYNAERFNCPMQDYPRIREINAHCLTLAAFQQAAPENQPDADT